METLTSIRLNFGRRERQVTDLLQFITIIDPAGIDTVEQTGGHGRLHAG